MPWVSFNNLISGWDNGAQDTHTYRQASSDNFLSSSWFQSMQFTSSQHGGTGYNACINMTYDNDQQVDDSKKGYVAWTNSVLANCTGFAHGVWLAYCGWNGVGSYPLNLSLGDGKSYWSYNQSLATPYQSGQIPKRGAIVCFAEETYGHIGVVESFTHAGNTYTIYIIQSAFAEGTLGNSSRTFFGTYLSSYDNGATWENQWGDYELQGFIYPPDEWFDEPTPPEPTPPSPTDPDLRIEFHKVLGGFAAWFFISSFLTMLAEPGITRYGDALWYSFVACTSIGFGDFTAVTFWGRLLTVLLTIYEIVIVAMFLSVVINYW